MFLRKPPNQSKIEYVNLRNVSYINETQENIILNMCFSYEDKKSRIISHQHFLSPDDKEFMKSIHKLSDFLDAKNAEAILAEITAIFLDDEELDKTKNEKKKETADL